MALNLQKKYYDILDPIKQGLSQIGNSKVNSIGQSRPNIPQQNSLTPTFKKVTQPIVNKVANTNLISAGLSAFPTTKVIAPYIKPPSAPTVGEYAQGQFIKPIKVALNSKAPKLDRITSGVQAGLSLTPSGTAYNLVSGQVSGLAQGIRTKQNPIKLARQATANPTSFATTGLGIKNPVLALGVDLLAGSPRGALKQAGKIRDIKVARMLKDVSPRAFNIHPEDRALLVDVVGRIQAGQKLYDEDLVDFQRLTDHYLGNKWSAQSTKKIAKAFDYFLAQQEGGIYGKFPKAGLVGQNEVGRNVGSSTELGKLLKGEPYKPAGYEGMFEATPQTMKKVVRKQQEDYARSMQKDFTEWKKQVRTQEAPRSVGGAIDDLTGQIKQNTVSPLSRDVANLKDISGFTAGTRDVYRNFKAVFGKNFDSAKQAILDPLDKSKGAFIGDLKRLTDDLDKNIVKGLGIKKGSKESALVQQYGEGLISLDDLQRQTPNWQKIVKADEFFRRNYDQLLDEVNQVRARIYPNQPDKIIPKRKDYYRHFRELEDGFKGLTNIFDTPAQIGSTLSGVSEYAKPRSKFLSFAQKRIGGKTEYDAVGGYLDYIKSQAYAKNIDPNISNFRNLADELATQTAEGPNAGKLNNFIEFLQDYANDLSGKTNPLDRTVQKWIPGGRQSFRAINWLNSRVKANSILGNISSTVAQAANIPQGIASAGPVNASKGIARTLASVLAKDKVSKQSTFLNERYFRAFDKFDRGMVANTKRGAAWITQVLDEIGTKSIWNMHYEKALSEGIQNPVKYADDITRELVAGRGIGEVPLMQKSKMFQLVAPFQLEVANLWWVMKDMVDERKFGQLAALAIGNFLFNRAAEQIRGSDVTFDPIQAALESIDTFNQEDDKRIGTFRGVGRLGGEVFSNVPLGQTLASIYPEYGVKIGDTQLPTRENFFGKGDPTRYGSGLLAAKGLQDPIFKVLPPFGGAQMKKLIEGKKTNDKEYSETKSGRVRFQTDNTSVKNIQRLLFGQYASSDGKNYFDNNRSPLGDEQSKIFKELPRDQRKEYIDSIYKKRENDKLIEQIKTKLEKGEDASGLIEQVSAAEETTPTNNKLLIEAQEDIAKQKVKIQGMAQKVGDKYFYLKDNGETGTINLTPPTKGSGIDAFTNKNWKAEKARETYYSTLNDESKDEIYKRLGINKEDIRYDVLSSSKYNVQTRADYIESKNLDHNQLIQRLLTGRVVSISGNQFASNGVLDALEDRGLITKAENKALTKIKTDKDGKQKSKISVGSGRKRNAPVILIPKAPRVKTYTPKITRIKPRKIRKIKLSTKGPNKLKRV